MRLPRLAYPSLVLLAVTTLGAGACGRTDLLAMDAAGGTDHDGRSPDSRDARDGSDGNVYSIDTYDLRRPDMPPDVRDPEVMSLSIEPPLVSLAPGTRVALTATALLADRTRSDVTSFASWKSSNDAVATVEVGGRVSANRTGTVRITASYMGRTATSTAIVTSATLRTITVEPAMAIVPKGSDPLSYRATGIFSDGTKQDITGDADWSSSDTRVATITNSGHATGRAGGKTTITATWMGQSARATLEVTGTTLVSIDISPVNPTLRLPGSRQLNATGIYDDGTSADLTGSVTWESGNAKIVTVSGRGVVTAVAPGTTTVRARLGNVSGSTNVTVSKAVLKAITISPAMASVPKGTTQKFTATGSYDDGTTRDITDTANWASSAPRVAFISNTAPAGVATTLAEGSTDVSATLDRVVGLAKITVTPVAISSLAITPRTASVAAGYQVKFTARATFSDGTSKDVTPEASWSTADAGVAAVANAPQTAGLVTGVKSGKTTLTASYNGTSDTATVTVSEAVLDHMTLTPPSASVVLGLQVSFTAKGIYSDGSEADLTNQATWTSSNRTVAFVSNQAGTKGQASTNAAGTSTITATASGKRGTAVLTVIPAELKAISVEPINPTLQIDETATIVAYGIYSNGTSDILDQGVTWTWPTTTTVAQVTKRSSWVSVRCLMPGMVTITGSYMSFTDSTTITCKAPPKLIGVGLNPVEATIEVGGYGTFSATLLHDDGSLGYADTATWSSSDPKIATVQGDGGYAFVQGVAVGTITITVKAMGFSAQAQVTVKPVPVLTGIKIVPDKASVRVGERRILQVVGIYSDGTTGDFFFGCAWLSSDMAIADVATGFERSGEVFGRALGMATITVSCAGPDKVFRADSAITVTAAKLTDIIVSPTAASVPVGWKQQYSAIARYDDNSSEDVTLRVVWRSSDPAVAGIVSDINGLDPQGMVTALKPGTTTISAEIMGVKGVVALTVTTAKLSGVTVVPARNVLQVGDAESYQAVAVFDDGTSQEVGGLARWSSSDPNVVTADFGLVTARSGGMAKVLVDYLGKSGAGDVTVTAASLRLVRITPASDTIAVGAFKQFVAEAVYADNLVQDVTAKATWSSSSSTVADVSRGIVAGKAAGAVTITATYKGLTGRSTVTVK